LASPSPAAAHELAVPEVARVSQPHHIPRSRQTMLEVDAGMI